MARVRKRKMISTKVKKQILAELLAPGCVVTKLAKTSGVAQSTLHKWKSCQLRNQVLPNANFGSNPNPAFDSAIASAGTSPGTNHFVELKVTPTACTASRLQFTKALLVCEDFSISLEGSISSSKVCAIFRVLEETC